MTRRFFILTGLLTLMSCAGLRTGPIEDSPLGEVVSAVEPRQDEGRTHETLVILATTAVVIQKTHTEPEKIAAIEGDKVAARDPEDILKSMQLGGIEDGRIFLNFNLQVIPKGSEIVSATLELSKTESDTNGPVEIVYGASASHWTAGVTWDKQPLIDDETQSTITTDDEWLDRLDVLPLVEAWMRGDLPMHGLVLTSTPDAYNPFKSYHSCESSNLDVWPRLVTRYKRR